MYVHKSELTAASVLAANPTEVLLTKLLAMIDAISTHNREQTKLFKQRVCW
jgi:hypothetical protein